MRLVLDTNVLVAAFIARGTCAELFEHCVRSHTLVTTEPLLAELSRTLTKKLRFSHRDAKDVLTLLRTRVEIVDAPPLDGRVCRDPDDDQVLAAALAGRCECLITGDQDLLDLGLFRDIPIVTPTQFWKTESE